MREVYFRNTKCKNCVGGKIDVITGRPKNGSKARISVAVGKNKLENIYLGSVCEAKNFTVRFFGHLPDSRTSVDEDVKSIYQPITEVCAVSELCTITCDKVPVVNVFGSRHT